jgi:hypothetical protein
MRRSSVLVAGVVVLAACSDRPHAPPPVAAAAAAQAPAQTALASRGPDVLAPPQQPAAVEQQAQAPAEPPYDLASDRERRARVARDELGARTVVQDVSDVFVTIGPPKWQGPAFDTSVSLMRSAMQGYMNGRFGKKPERAISVYLFPDAVSYEAFCRKKYDAPCIAHYGFYHPADRYMVMNAGLGLGTLTHELVHPLVEADFPGAPTWINEGIASLFEQPVIGKPGEIHGGKNWRWPRVARAVRGTEERHHARLDVLFGMRDDVFRGDREDLHYAMARYVCQWLDERGKLWPFYQRWRDHAAEDSTGERSFTEVVGMSPVQAHDAWAKWLLSL